MVPIFTYRDERKLFALAGTIIVAALLALLQLDYVRSGRPSPFVTAATSIVTWVQFAAVSVVNGTRDTFTNIVQLPSLAHANAGLNARVIQLQNENDELRETLSRVPAEAAEARAQLHVPGGIEATVVAFDPENALRTVTINRGAHDHVALNDGVIAGDGVVGRVVEVDPISSKVLLIDDPTSRLPVLIQRGRWWAIATGTLTSVKLRFVSQDAKLHVGDAVVTGEGRSFRAGVLVGRISQVVPMPAGALDQTAIVAPEANLAALTRVLVVPK